MPSTDISEVEVTYESNVSDYTRLATIEHVTTHRCQPTSSVVTAYNGVRTMPTTVRDTDISMSVDDR